MSSPAHWQQQRQPPHLSQQYFGMHPGMLTPSPATARRSSPFDPYGLYSHWSGMPGVADGFGYSDWDLANAGLSPLHSPLHQFSGDMAGYDAALYGAWPSTPQSMLATPAAATLGSAVQRSIVFGTEAEAEERAASPSASSVHSEAGEAENRPAAANRATTPPPARASKPTPPPGLGMLASPMKIDVSFATEQPTLCAR